MRRGKIHWQVVTVCLLGGWLLGASIQAGEAKEKAKAKEEPKAVAAAPVQAEVPDAASIEKTLAEVKEIFADEYAAKDEETRRGFVYQLSNKANEATKDPVVRYVLLSETARMAAENGMLPMVQDAVGRLADGFTVDGLKTRLDYYDKIELESRDAPGHVALTSAYLVLKDNAVEADRYEIADDAMNKAKKLVKKTNDTAFGLHVKDLAKDLSALKSKYQRLRNDLKTIADNPDDPKANQEIGEYYCFVKNDWQGGLPFLAKSGEEAQKNAAKAELAKPEGADAVVKLADAWWDLGEKEHGKLEKKYIMIHAALLYEPVVANLTGLDKTRVSKRLDDVYALPLMLQGYGTLQNLSDKKLWDRSFDERHAKEIKYTLKDRNRAIEMLAPAGTGTTYLIQHTPRNRKGPTAVLKEFSATVTLTKKVRDNLAGLYLRERGFSSRSIEFYQVGREVRFSHIAAPIRKIVEIGTPYRLGIRIHPGTMFNERPTYDVLLDGEVIQTFDLQIDDFGLRSYQAQARFENVRVRW